VIWRIFITPTGLRNFLHKGRLASFRGLKPEKESSLRKSLYLNLDPITKI